MTGATEPLPLLERILAARGMTDAEEITLFLEPKLSHLHDPALLPNIDVAVERIIDAVKNNRRIVIYGDYDVDGITATAILYHVLRTAKPDADVCWYVPHRLDEGYGLNVEAIRQLHADGTSLIITVDCGVSAIEPARVATELGMELIITDHHHPPADGILPEVTSIVHPRLPDSEYPFGDLCGAGVAFKIAWRFATAWCGSDRVSAAMQKVLLDMLPLAALGTIADVVPLIDENRIIATYGLRMIKQTPISGLRALIEAANLMGEDIDCEKIGFVLGPRLNACGRMGHAADAVRMLTDATSEQARDIAVELTRLNQQRQNIQREIVDQATRMAEDAGMTGDDRRIIVLKHSQWHPGIVGIACARLVDQFCRPVILLQKQDDICKGSARSIDGYSVHAALSACSEHLTTYGGHEAAAGLSVATSGFDAFVEAIAAHANEQIDVDQLTRSISIDCDAELHELTKDAVKQIQQLSPFGCANPRPTIRINNVVIADAPKQMGGYGRHLSFRLRDNDESSHNIIRAVWWRRGDLASDLAPGMNVDVVLTPKLNHWNGRTSVEVEISDVRVVEPATV